ncbi:DUF397 domain-containing protein [Streptomyces sp. H10-C2]|uniref:DUF397 domain-containing protein n=1 Tax=unclassified Streptomyces TaxID=2593676 RepID=UPI0024BB6DCA|nr:MULTISPECIES: DUF397 domain-containing protein [unclassified Streptomyces]MDJ0345472.1 DUF397 domain-containing protein [Streptomyces sp. PH10-H1]MDJ0374264.1 DUF397 domain-containing protein [Streptomyces sp. H10-C2]
MTAEEVAPHAAEARWLKSSYSDNEGGNCIEIATRPGTVLVRDSKDPEGPKLVLDADAWRSFVRFAASADLP